MSSINGKIRDIFQKNEGKHGSKSEFVQELFDLIPHSTSEELPTLQSAILFAMESLHEWQNVNEYIEKWQSIEFRGKFIQRMKKRVNEDCEERNIVNSKDELDRLLKIYNERNPKQEETKYTYKLEKMPSKA